MAEQYPKPVPDHDEPVDLPAVPQDRPRHEAAPSAPVPEDDLVDLRFLVQELWKRKYALLVFALIGLAIGVWNLRTFKPEYVAKMVVLPALGGPSTGVTDQAGGILRGLGVKVGNQTEATPFDRLVIMLWSIPLAEGLQKKYGFLQLLFEKSWDAENQSWIRPSGTRFEWEQKIKSFVQLKTWREPGIEALAAHIGNKIIVEDVDDLPFKSITYLHQNRDVALNVLNTVYHETDELVRRKDRQTTAERRRYIQTQIASTPLIDSKTALNQILIGIERRAMLLEGGLPYAAQIVDPPYVSDVPTEPLIIEQVGAPVFILVGIGVLWFSMVALFGRRR